MNVVNATFESGDTVAVGRINHAEVEQANSRVHLRILWQDEPEEHVVLTENVENGDDLEIHSRATVVGFVESSGVANDRVVYLIPLKYYGE